MCVKRKVQQVQYIEGPTSKCDKCLVVKPLLAFDPFPTYWMPKGLYRWCKCCRSAHLSSYNPYLVSYLTNLFQGIKRACEDSQHPNYANWGALGIEDDFYSADQFIEHIVEDLNITSIDQIKDLILSLIHANIPIFGIGNIHFIERKEEQDA